MNITSFNIPSLVGPDVVARVSSALQQVQGVSSVTINSSARLVQVRYDSDVVPVEALKAAIEGAGLRVQRYSDGHRS